MRIKPLVGSIVVLQFILVACRGITISHSSFSKSSASPLTKTDLQESELTGFDEQGNKLIFQIRDVELDPLDPQKETYLYTIFFRDVDQTWKNLCKPDIHNVAKAIVLKGFWNAKGAYQGGEKQVTLSCTNGALGKCVRFGYKPWKTLNKRSLRDFHQSCVRMVRADYCGDGIGHTKDGTPINIYDSLGIQKPDTANDMSFEAAWGVNGAYCINHVRWPEGLSYVQRVCPERLASTLKGGNHCTTSEQAHKYFPQALLFNDSIVRKS